MGVGAWNKADYVVRRGGVDVKMPLIVGEVPRDPAVFYLYFVGLAYLAIGLFVYFRRGTAYKAQHFYVFCLVSFIFCTFHYTGKLNNFDKLIYWGNVVAGMLAPVIFVHFCLSFPGAAAVAAFPRSDGRFVRYCGVDDRPLRSGQLGDAAHLDSAG